jgi:predicted MFS family arabinose efflux permease
MPILYLLATACFTSAMLMRITDPMVPEIARNLNSLPATVALLGTAFALPYALSQPVLGPMGDALGKARIMKWCMGLLAVAVFLSALAPNLEMLFAARVLAGLAGGGTFPLAIAICGDRFPLAERQVALSRVLMAALVGQLVGSIGSGLLAEYVGWRFPGLTGWRVVTAAGGIMAVAAFLLLHWQLKPRPGAVRRQISLTSMRTSYRTVFANPRAAVCYGAVFVEGVCIFGLVPYLAVLLEASGRGSIKEAGFVLAGLGLGGLVFGLLVKQLLKHLGGQMNMIRAGGVVAACGFAGYALNTNWQPQMAGFIAIGLGFYMIHNSLQTQATELAPNERGAAVSLHAFFFFLGHATGPVLYRFGIGNLGSKLTVLLSAAAMAALGFVVATLLTRAKPQVTAA